jgi:hypothetical protein
LMIPFKKYGVFPTVVFEKNLFMAMAHLLLFN